MHPNQGHKHVSLVKKKKNKAQCGLFCTCDGDHTLSGDTGHWALRAVNKHGAHGEMCMLAEQQQ